MADWIEPEIKIYLYSNEETEDIKKATKIYAKKHGLEDKPNYIIAREMLTEKAYEILKRK